MSTAPRDRLSNLLSTQPLPPLSNPQQAHVADSEVEAETVKEQTWQIPEVAQYPRHVSSKESRQLCGADVLTSSDDDDDYVASFTKKPKMKQVKYQRGAQERRVLPEPNALEYPQGAKIKPKGPINYLPDADSDENCGVLASPLPKQDDQENNVAGQFCLFNLVSIFPYKYMTDSNDRVSRHFFANGKFYNRTWNLYYLQPPAGLYEKALILVPHAQVQNLVDEIGKVFKCETAVPPFPFTISFFADGTPQPQFLGTSHSREEVNELTVGIPEPPPNHGEAPADASPAVGHIFAAYRAKVETALAANKKKNAAVKKKRGIDQQLIIKDRCMQLKRAQRYLGLRPQSIAPQGCENNRTWAEQEAFRVAEQKNDNAVLDPLKTAEISLYPFDKELVIVSIDVESWERSHNLITEIGISTLDTLDVVNLPPGPGGENWMKQIRSRHFRIKGRDHLANKDFCYGDPSAFQFGESEFVSLEEAPEAVDSCFEWPFSITFKHDGRLKFHNDDDDLDALDSAYVNGDVDNLKIRFEGVRIGPTNAEQDAANQAAVTNILGPSDPTLDPSTLQKGPHTRNILLVGHDISGDLVHLSNLGSEIFSTPASDPVPEATVSPTSSAPLQSTRHVRVVPHILEALDTAELYRVLKRESQPRSLTALLADLGRCGWYMHNGGNDARYTLEAFVALVIKSRIIEDEEQQRGAKQSRNQFTSVKLRLSKREAEQKIKETEKQAKNEVGEDRDVWEQVDSSETKRFGGDGAGDEGVVPSVAAAAPAAAVGRAGGNALDRSRGTFATSLPIPPFPFPTSIDIGSPNRPSSALMYAPRNARQNPTNLKETARTETTRIGDASQ